MPVDDPASAPPSDRSAPRREARWIELSPEASQRSFAEAVREGIGQDPKTLPSQFFYDAEGSALFEEICELPEYYLTRAETEILNAHSGDLARDLSEIETLVELGSGSATKTEILLRAFEGDGRTLAYAPIDVSRSALEASVERLESRHPELEVLPAHAEYEAGLEAITKRPFGPKLLLWLGSSIGNLTRRAAAGFLAGIGRRMASEDRMLVGIDLRKDRETLERAYDDSRGVTARFDLNLLARINRELGGRFDLDRFRHRVHYDEGTGSVRSYLESRVDQRVRVDALDLEVSFAEGERIHTEDSHKYSPDEIDDLARQAGLRLERRRYDGQRRFALVLFAAASCPA